MYIICQIARPSTFLDHRILLVFGPSATLIGSSVILSKTLILITDLGPDVRRFARSPNCPMSFYLSIIGILNTNGSSYFEYLFIQIFNQSRNFTTRSNNVIIIKFSLKKIDSMRFSSTRPNLFHYEFCISNHISNWIPNWIPTPNHPDWKWISLSFYFYRSR